MAIFDRLDRQISRTIDRQFAVGAVVQTMTKSPNGRPTPDPVRGEILLVGVFEQAPGAMPIEQGARGRGRGNELQAIVSGDTYELSVDIRRYPEAANVQQNDRLVLDDTRRFVVDSVQPDGQARVVLVLSKV
jgi:hypothetical protein